MPAPASRRIAAFAADYVILAAYITVLTALSFLFGVGRLFDASTLAGKMSSHAMAFLSLTLPVVLYFTLTERGDRAASLGKRLVGLRVLGPDGGPPTFTRALLRNAIKFAPWELAHAAIWYTPGQPFIDPMPPANLALCVVSILLVITWLASLASRDGRTPYDRLSRTRVVKA
jgi:uncharacterized RDD family membrane protein YckC